MSMKNGCLLFLIMVLALRGYGQDKKILGNEFPNDVVKQSTLTERVAKDDMRESIVKAFLTDTAKRYLADMTMNEAHLVSLTISFDSGGKVDSIYFPNKVVNSLIKFLGSSESLKYSISKALIPHTSYKDVVVLLPIIFHNADHELINKYSFLNEFINMLPDLSNEDKLKHFVLLEPYNRWISIRY